MEGFKLIKTIFESNKEIIGVNFNGDESYYLFLNEVKKAYNIPKGTEIQVYSNDFIIKPNIFVHFVAQYINNLDFVLNIKVTKAAPKQYPTVSVVLNSDQIPTTAEIKKIPEVQQALDIGTLENKHRTNIAKAIISMILTDNPDRRLLRDEFLQLSKSIVEIFPSEVKETYYVPFTKGHLAKGKLHDAYNNTRSRLRLSGVIRRRNKNKPEPTVFSDDSSTLSDGEVDEKHLEVLKSGYENWDLVLKTWRKTHRFRQNEFKKDNLKAIEYMEKYKVLQNERNYELFEIDFNMLYPNSKSIYEWQFYYHKVIDKAKKLKDNSVKDIVTCISNTCDEDTILALSLLLVPYLLPTSRQWSKMKVQESFISFSMDIVKEEYDDNDVEQKRLKLDNQPKVYLIGNSSNTLSYTYLDIYRRRHRFENPLQAIEVCFHCFMGMNIKYPKLCEHVWLFVQKLIFQITTPDDIIIPSINTLINDLQQ